MSFPKKVFTSDAGETDGSSEYAKASQSYLTIESVIGTNRSVEFKAFLTSFTQNFISKWNSQEVYGRNDPIATFQGTSRTISLAWSLPAASVNEAKHNLESTALLSQMLYPAYEENIIAKPPLVKIRFSNLIVNNTNSEGLLGWINGLTIDPVLDMGMFTTAGSHYPKVINLSFTFNVLHQHDIGVDTDGKLRSGGDAWPFIG